MGYLNKNYVIGNENEVSELIAEIPLGLLKGLIIEQIADPNSSLVDNLTVIYDKLDSIEDEIDGDVDDLREIKGLREDISMFVIKEVVDKFNLGHNINPELESLDTLMEVAKALYGGLVLGFKENNKSFLFNYVMTNSEALLNELEPDDAKKRDFLISAHKKEGEQNIGNVRLIASIRRIITNILDNKTIDPEEFIRYSDMNSTEEGEILESLYEEQKIIGNFVDVYNDILDENSYIRLSIMNEVMVELVDSLF